MRELFVYDPYSPGLVFKTLGGQRLGFPMNEIGNIGAVTKPDPVELLSFTLYWPEMRGRIDREFFEAHEQHGPIHIEVVWFSQLKKSQTDDASRPSNRPRDSGRYSEYVQFDNKNSGLIEYRHVDRPEDPGVFYFNNENYRRIGGSKPHLDCTGSLFCRSFGNLTEDIRYSYSLSKREKLIDDWVRIDTEIDKRLRWYVENGSRKHLD